MDVQGEPGSVLGPTVRPQERTGTETRKESSEWEDAYSHAGSILEKEQALENN